MYFLNFVVHIFCDVRDLNHLSFPRYLSIYLKYLYIYIIFAPNENCSFVSFNQNIDLI